LLIHNHQLLTAGGSEGFYLWNLPESRNSEPFDPSNASIIAHYNYTTSKPKNTMVIHRKSFE